VLRADAQIALPVVQAVVIDLIEDRVARVLLFLLQGGRFTAEAQGGSEHEGEPDSFTHDASRFTIHD